jgi:tripartite-type tricarboxylate transporter receptor subunit TctC
LRRGASWIKLDGNGPRVRPPIGRLRIRRDREELLTFTLKTSVALAAIIGGMGAGARAEAADYFSGKTITVVAGAEPGGGYDLYSRLFASRLSDLLPGHPRVVVENMGAAGGLVAANYLYNLAPHDGTTIGMISQTAAIGQAVGTPGIKYDVRKFGWIGRLTSNTQVLQTWHTSTVKTFEDAKTKVAVMAGTGPTSSSVVFPKIMNDQIGTKFKLVPGFSGEAAATLAMQRGEVDGVVRPWDDLKGKNPDWLSGHLVNLIVQFSITPNAEISDVPAIVDLAKTSAQRELFALFASGNDVGDSIIAPPDTTPGALEALRTAYDKMVVDQKFLADAARAHSHIVPLSGADLEKLNKSVFDVPPDIIALAKTYVAPH